MTKKSIEKTIADLRALCEDYKTQVNIWNDAQIEASEKFTHYSDLVTQTEDAINALEGKPTLKKMLEAALETKSPSADIPKSQRTPTNAESANLPPAEPGFVWRKNEIGQDILVAEILTLGLPAAAQEENYLTLPPVIGEDDFEDSPEDLIE